eukprot:scaffold249353_cov82-Cyclotella_meneghiniana.AAC.13
MTREERITKTLGTLTCHELWVTHLIQRGHSPHSHPSSLAKASIQLRPLHTAGKVASQLCKWLRENMSFRDLRDP